MKVLTSTCSSSPVEPILVSVEHWLTVLCTHSIFSSTWQAGLGGTDLSARGRERPKQMAEFSHDFPIHSRPSPCSSDIHCDIFAVFLQFDVTRWPELCFADDFLHLDHQCHQNYRLSKTMQLSQQKMKSHLRLLDFLLNSDHFQPTARRKGLQRNILKPSIIYL